jgi:hypothetical protein
MKGMEKLFKEQLDNYRKLLALSNELNGMLSENRSEEAESILMKRQEAINKVMALDEKIANSGGDRPEGSKTYSEIGKILEEIAAIDGRLENYLKEGKEEVIKSIKGLQKGKNAAKGYGSGRGKQHGGSGKFISIKE